MNASAPHFLLFSESSRTNDRGHWRFLLQSVDGTDQLEAADAEHHLQGERLELLAVVRGLEALAQPSRVTLVTPSKYVNRGMSYGLQEWRSNDWQWERFGEMVPIKNRDLWQRVDRALEFHQVDCRVWRFDAAECRRSEVGSRKAGNDRDHNSDFRPPTSDLLQGPHFLKRQPPAARAAFATQFTAPVVAMVADRTLSASRMRPLSRQLRRFRIKLVRLWTEILETVGLRMRQLGTCLLPLPWLD